MLRSVGAKAQVALQQKRFGLEKSKAFSKTVRAAFGNLSRAIYEHGGEAGTLSYEKLLKAHYAELEAAGIGKEMADAIAPYLGGLLGFGVISKLPRAIRGSNFPIGAAPRKAGRPLPIR